eukprot:271073-Amphidinium_carterae.1
MWCHALGRSVTRGYCRRSLVCGLSTQTSWLARSSLCATAKPCIFVASCQWQGLSPRCAHLPGASPVPMPTWCTTTTPMRTAHMPSTK